MWPRKVLLAVRRSQSRSDYEADLRQHGFQVITADDGIECLDVLCRFTPDAVVVEPELLWGGGDGVVSLLRDNPETRNVPVLVLTTDASRSAVYQISQFSIGDYLMQPVTPERLTGRVARLALGDRWPLTAESPRHTSTKTVACCPPDKSNIQKSVTRAGVS